MFDLYKVLQNVPTIPGSLDTTKRLFNTIGVRKTQTANQLATDLRSTRARYTQYMYNGIWTDGGGLSWCQRSTGAGYIPGHQERERERVKKKGKRSGDL